MKFNSQISSSFLSFIPVDGNGEILSSARRDGEMESEAEEIEEIEELEEENNGWELI